MIDKDVLIRRASHGDELQIWQVHTNAVKVFIGRDYSQEIVEEYLPSEPIKNIENITWRSFFVAEINNNIVGYSAIMLATGKIPVILIHSDYVRQGIGSRLMMEMERLAKENGVEVLKLNSTYYGHKFYKTLGFVGDELGVEIGPKTGMKVPCYPMTKKLP
ncbi:MAG: GNAT family N-acetyltransferase [Moorea sp. SIO2B7]|nr:GNAT family N-acetyltransferase [Moorena sp. SIO2B7]